MHGLVAALSAGIVHGRAILDLNYGEDSRAEVDCNVVMTDRGEIIEYQSTAERSPLTRDGLLRLLDLTAARHRAARGPAASHSLGAGCSHCLVLAGTWLASASLAVGQLRPHAIAGRGGRHVHHRLLHRPRPLRRLRVPSRASGRAAQALLLVHGWEYVPLLALAERRWLTRVTRGSLTLGYVVHLLIDQSPNDTRHPLSYLLTYRAARRFDASLFGHSDEDHAWQDASPRGLLRWL